MKQKCLLETTELDREIDFIPTIASLPALSSELHIEKPYV
jgi:hypothetical protein